MRQPIARSAALLSLLLLAPLAHGSESTKVGFTHLSNNWPNRFDADGLTVSASGIHAQHADVVSLHIPFSPRSIGAAGEDLTGRIPWPVFFHAGERTYAEYRAAFQTPQQLRWLAALDVLKQEVLDFSGDVANEKRLYLSDRFDVPRNKPLVKSTLPPDFDGGYPDAFCDGTPCRQVCETDDGPSCALPEYTDADVLESVRNYARFVVMHFNPHYYTPDQEWASVAGTVEKEFYREVLEELDSLRQADPSLVLGSVFPTWMYEWSLQGIGEPGDCDSGGLYRNASGEALLALSISQVFDIHEQVCAGDPDCPGFAVALSSYPTGWSPIGGDGCGSLGLRAGTVEDITEGATPAQTYYGELLAALKDPRHSVPTSTPIVFAEAAWSGFLDVTDPAERPLAEQERYDYWEHILSESYASVGEFPLEFVINWWGPDLAFRCEHFIDRASSWTLSQAQELCQGAEENGARHYGNGMVRFDVGLWSDATTGAHPMKAALLFDRYRQGVDAGGAFIDDQDGDAVPNLSDNCPYVGNPAQADADSDGFGDACDNCVDAPNEIQWDWDQDGYGNACDGDLNNDTRVNDVDRAILQECIGSGSERCVKGTYVHMVSGVPLLLNREKLTRIADLDGDGAVDQADLDAFDALYPDPGGSLQPGPSAAGDGRGSCAGSVPCPNPNFPR